MNPALQRLRLATEGTPYYGELWLVGGAVRDALLAGASPGDSAGGDLDFTLVGDALTLAKWLFEQGVSSIYPVLYERFGTAMVQIEGQQIEFATARSENYDLNSRKPDVRPATLLEDATRRDFTVNALYWNLHTGSLGDPLGLGHKDLKVKTLRTPTDPLRTFSEDPLRILRAVRFKHQLGFKFAQGMREALKESAPRLSIISKERIMQEWSKMLTGPNPAGAMTDLEVLGVLAQFAPELSPLMSTPYLERARRSDLLVNAALVCLRLEPQKAAALLRRLKFPHDFADEVRQLLFLAPMFDQPWNATLARRIVHAAGPLLARALDVHLSTSLHPLTTANRDELHAIAHAAEHVPLESPLDGKEIMEITGLPPGTQVQQVKNELTEAVLAGTLQPGDTEGARKLLRNKKW